MGRVISFWDGKDIELTSPKVMDNFGCVIGLSFDNNGGKVDVAMRAVEVTNIIDLIIDYEMEKDDPNSVFIAQLRHLQDDIMDESDKIEIIAKCNIAVNYASITPRIGE